MDPGMVQQLLAQVGEIVVHGRLALEAARQGHGEAVREHVRAAVGLAQAVGG